MDKDKNLFYSILKVKKHKNTLFFHGTKEKHCKSIAQKGILPSCASGAEKSNGPEAEKGLIHLALNISTSESHSDENKIIKGTFSGNVIYFPTFTYEGENIDKTMHLLPDNICGIEYHELGDKYPSILIKYNRKENFEIQIEKSDKPCSFLSKIMTKLKKHK